MFSHEIQDYLEKRSYRLTLEEYYNIVNNSPQISSVKLSGSYEFFHKKEVATSDNYIWGIYILNYGVDTSKVKDIFY